jgi:ATP-binding cassette subfamily B protein
MPGASQYRAADRLLLRLLRQAGGWNWLLLAAGLTSTATSLAFPLAFGGVIDAVLGGRDPAGYVVAACVLVAVFVVTDAASELALTSASARATAWLRHSVLRHILRLGPRRAARFSPGEITARLVGNTAEAGRVTPMAAWCLMSFAPAVGGVVALVLIDPLLGVVFALAAPVLVGLVRLLVGRSSSAATEYLRAQGSIVAMLTGALDGARTIAAAASQEREARRVLAPLPDLRRHGRWMWTTTANTAVTGSLSGALLEVAVLGVAGVLLTRQRITPGELVAASQYVLLAAGLPGPLQFVARFGRSRAGAARVAEIEALAPVGYGDRALPGTSGGRLEFRDVTVRVDGRAVLEHLELVVPEGTLMAVVGRSGTGKSTLAALAGRLVDPDTGAVLLDGVPLADLSGAELRRAVSFGFERPVLVGDTVAEAIALGVQVPAERVAAAADAACADGFVRRLPAGYATPMAQAPLSGGEAQRLGVARAFVRPARVLVLDDATSNLDTLTEAQIAGVLTGELGRGTRVLVAHRVTTAARADLVAWLDGGRVRRVAPHDELWRDQAYREVFAS